MNLQCWTDIGRSKRQFLHKVWSERKKGLITESLKINTEMMTGADKDIILQAVSLLENVDEENNACTLESLIHEYNAPDNNYKLLNSIECDKFKK